MELNILSALTREPLAFPRLHPCLSNRLTKSSLCLFKPSSCFWVKFKSNHH